jgi:hypothetical protein
MKTFLLSILATLAISSCTFEYVPPSTTQPADQEIFQNLQYTEEDNPRQPELVSTGTKDGNPVALKPLVFRRR